MGRGTTPRRLEETGLAQDRKGASDARVSLDGAPDEGARPVASPASLAHQIGDLILDNKGLGLTVISVEPVTTLCDYIVLATATSARQVHALARDIMEFAKASKKKVLSCEGLEQGWWVLIDLGEVIVHVMQPEAREYYDLENIWADGRVVRRVEDPDQSFLTT